MDAVGATITVGVSNSSDGSAPDIPSGGPEIGVEITVSSSSFNDYQYCDSTDLVYYTLMNNWPYAEYHTTVDHPSCAIVVCDLDIESFVTTNETGLGNTDGTITVTATSSNGTIKYSLDPDFDYATEGTTGAITGLSTGNYVVYAKDAGGCVDLVNVFVGIDFVYGPRWRVEYDTVNPEGYISRIDIEERDYVGAVTEVCSGEKPFELEYNEEDSTQLVASNAQIQLLCETESQFDDIRTGYDRKFLVKKYKDLGLGFILEWVGYITPEFYQEPYIFEPYVITLKALDGLGDMSKKPFVALSGEEYFGNMTVLQILTECLKKLPYAVNLRSCVNIFEVNMDTAATDDPLPQTVIKSENYRGKKCGEVITSLIKPFTRAQLFQSLGYWWVRTKEQAVYSSLDYREFDEEGVFVDNDTISSRKSAGFPSTLSRFCWTDRSQLLTYTRNYGVFTITHDLGKDNNMVDSGSFEQKDIDLATEFFRGWQIFPAQTNVSAGLEYVDNGDSKGAFVFNFGPGGSDQADNYIASEALPISINPANVFSEKSTSFKLKFQTYTSPSWPSPWIRIGWKFRFTDTDTGDFWDYRPMPSPLSAFPDVNEDFTNDIYITSFNSWQTHEFYNFRFPGDIDAVNFTVQLFIYFHNHKGRDFGSYALLKAFPTVDIEEGKRVYIANASAVPTGTNDNTYGYELQHSVEAESIPDIVEPDDYAIISNEFKWIKVAEISVDGDVPLLDRILIDNVKVSLFAIDPILDGPGVALIDPPETAVYENEVSTLNESLFEDTVTAGDAPDIVGYNYIYNGFFKLADDTRTENWFRAGITEERLLLDIYLGHISAQGANSLRVLSGSGIADIQLGFIHSLEDQIDDRRYRFKRFLMDDKQGSFEIEMEETLTGADGESPPDPVGVLLNEDGTPILTEDGDYIYV